MEDIDRQNQISKWVKMKNTEKHIGGISPQALGRFFVRIYLV
jgi:hypothetical protein